RPSTRLLWTRPRLPQAGSFFCVCVGRPSQRFRRCGRLHLAACRMYTCRDERPPVSPVAEVVRLFDGEVCLFELGALHLFPHPPWGCTAAGPHDRSVFLAAELRGNLPARHLGLTPRLSAAGLLAVQTFELLPEIGRAAFDCLRDFIPQL